MPEPTSDAVRRTDPGTAKGEATDRAPSRTQLLVARRVAESRATVPDVTLTTEVDMEAAVARQPELTSREASVHALDALVLRATALALRAFPQANGAWRDARLVAFPRVNLGLAVPVEDTLVVPTVVDADTKPATQIAEELAGLVARVHAGEITQPELSGATFTVTNLGVYGPRRVTAVIIPPQAGILAVGALTRRPAVHDGELVARHGLDLTLAADHRVLYGATAALFLERIREELEAA
jgi:pyruvate dehydrogenase E2 component (dihydrolipoamide acetyltransferase)